MKICPRVRLTVPNLKAHFLPRATDTENLVTQKSRVSASKFWKLISYSEYYSDTTRHHSFTTIYATTSSGNSHLPSTWHSMKILTSSFERVSQPRNPPPIATSQGKYSHQMLFAAPPPGVCAQCRRTTSRSRTTVSQFTIVSVFYNLAQCQSLHHLYRAQFLHQSTYLPVYQSAAMP